MSLTDIERELANRIHFDPSILELVKEASSGSIVQATQSTEEIDEAPADAISTQMSSDDVETFINSRQAELVKRGYRAFWSKRIFPNIRGEKDDLVVLKTSDPFEILRMRSTDGSNYGLDTNDIILRLQAWSTLCQFDVVGAHGDWAALTFQTLPQDLCGFASEVYDFCPDTVEQGVGLLREENEPERFAAARKLCSDGPSDYRKPASSRQIELENIRT